MFDYGKDTLDDGKGQLSHPLLSLSLSLSKSFPVQPAQKAGISSTGEEYFDTIAKLPREFDDWLQTLRYKELFFFLFLLTPPSVCKMLLLCFTETANTLYVPTTALFLSGESLNPLECPSSCRSNKHQYCTVGTQVAGRVSHLGCNDKVKCPKYIQTPDAVLQVCKPD